MATVTTLRLVLRELSRWNLAVSGWPGCTPPASWSRSGCQPEADRAATQGALDASARERMIWAEMTAA
jgi:hypothetical protein